MVLQCLYRDTNSRNMRYNAHCYSGNVESVWSMTFCDPFYSQHGQADLMKSGDINTAKPGHLKHKRRYCRVDGCNRIVKSQGLCQRHGAKPKMCKIEGCRKQAQGNFEGMCKAHFREHSAVTNTEAISDEIVASLSSTNATVPSYHSFVHQPPNQTPSSNYFGGPQYEHLPYPNPAFSAPPLEWTTSYGSYPPFPQAFHPIPSYPPAPWLMPPSAVASYDATGELPTNPRNTTGAFYDPGSLESVRTFPPDRVESNCDATYLLRLNSVATLNDDINDSTAPTDHPSAPHPDDVSLLPLEAFPDDDDSILGGPHTAL